MASVTFRSSHHFSRVINDLLRFVHPRERLATIEGAPLWRELAPRVQSASLDVASEAQLVMSCAMELDRMLALWGVGPADAEATASSATCSVAVQPSARGGRGVYTASAAVPFGTVLARYAGRTILHGGEADDLTAIAERQRVWEDVAASGVSFDSERAHALALREAYRKLNGFPAALSIEGYEAARKSTLVFGSWSSESDTLFDCGSMVNDPAALLLDPPSLAALEHLGEREEEAEEEERDERHGAYESTLDQEIARYQAAALDGANVTMVPRGGSLFCISTSVTPISPSTELLYPYGTHWWLGHARETLLDNMAVAIVEGAASRKMIRGGRRAVEAMERASQRALENERVVLGRTGAMERCGVAPLGQLPRRNPPIFALKLFERCARLQSGAAHRWGDNAAGTREVSPREGATRTPPLNRADLEAFQATWQGEL